MSARLQAAERRMFELQGNLMTIEKILGRLGKKSPERASTIRRKEAVLAEYRDTKALVKDLRRRVTRGEHVDAEPVEESGPGRAPEQLRPLLDGVYNDLALMLVAFDVTELELSSVTDFMDWWEHYEGVSSEKSS